MRTGELARVMAEGGRDMASTLETRVDAIGQAMAAKNRSNRRISLATRADQISATLGARASEINETLGSRADIIASHIAYLITNVAPRADEI